MLTTRNIVALCLLVAFAVTVGHAVRVAFGPPGIKEHFVQGPQVCLLAQDQQATRFVLRRRFEITQPPQHAWLLCTSGDRVQIYVNGELVKSRRPFDGLSHALRADITPLLRVGSNLIAIDVEQAVDNRRPMVAVDGRCILDHGEISLAADRQWRVSQAFHRDGAWWWFEPDFDDRNWKPAKLATLDLIAPLNRPLRATTEPPAGHWLAPETDDAGGVLVRRDFELDAAPTTAWMRLTTTSNFNLVINGHEIDRRDASLGTGKAITAVQRTYDLCGLLRAGQNTVAVVMKRESNAPHLRVDLEIEPRSGDLLRFDSDQAWRGIATSFVTTEMLGGPMPRSARPCTVQAGRWLVPHHKVARASKGRQRPTELAVKDLAFDAAIIVGVAILSALGALLAVVFLVFTTRCRLREAIGIAALAFAAPAVLAGGAWLATLDWRVTAEQVFQPKYVVLLLLSVPLQWVLLAALAYFQSRRPNVLGQPASSRLPQAFAVTCAALVVVAVGLVVRYEGLGNRLLGSDESHMYRCTQGYFERGFPSYVVHRDMPIQYVATSELVYIGPVIAAHFSDDPTFIVRFPAVVWGTATIVLIFIVGYRMFSPATGLLAAALYCLAPVCVKMANFGRYPSQLQFFALLTVFLFWRTIEKPGELKIWPLWLTVISFVAMFFSWQASAIVALGMVTAVLWVQRGHLHKVFTNPHVWAGIVVVVLCFGVAYTHRQYQQAQRLIIGMGASEVKLTPMWRLPNFKPLRYINQSMWCDHARLPLISVFAGALLVPRHRFGRQAAYMLTVFLCTALFMAFLLPVKAGRYSYFLIPLCMLLCSAAAVAGAEQLAHLIPRRRVAVRAFAWAVAGLLLLAVAFEASGFRMESRKLQTLAAADYPVRPASGRSLGGLAFYLRDVMQDGDIVLATQPYLLNTQMALPGINSRQLEEDCTFWLQTRLHQQGVLDDNRHLPLNRRDGTTSIQSAEALALLFAQHERIWLVVTRSHFRRLNVDDVGDFIQQHMDVSYVDHASVVLFYGHNHRPAVNRLRDFQMLEDAEAEYLN